MKTQQVVVTADAGTRLKEPTVATPPGVPDIRIVAMSRVRQVSIRAARTYLQALVGFLIAGGVGIDDALGVPLPANDFLSLLLQSAGLAVAPAVIAVLQNAVELLAELDSARTRA